MKLLARGIGDAPFKGAVENELYIWSLLNEGDWACAHADGEALARVCEGMCARLRGERGARAERIAETALFDVETASALWAALANELRGDIAVVQQ